MGRDRMSVFIAATDLLRRETWRQTSPYLIREAWWVLQTVLSRTTQPSTNNLNPMIKECDTEACCNFWDMMTYPKRNNFVRKPWQMERHMRIHTDGKSFSCPTCKKCFNQKKSGQARVETQWGETACLRLLWLRFTQNWNLKMKISRSYQGSVMVTPNSVVQQDKTSEV